MASVCCDPGGRKRILFVGADGQRRPIRLGKCSKRVAQRVCTFVESLAASARAHTTWEPEAADWVGKLESILYGKLAAVGLVPPREPAPDEQPETMTLGVFLDSYINGRTDIKPRTRINMTQAKQNLTRFFGVSKPLADITPGDADDFRLDLLGRLSENTARRHCGRAKQFFRAAVRKRLIAESPFGDMKGVGVKGNAARFYFLSLDDAGKVLDACPDAQWRLLFALSRYGGLRCPSEHLGLTWSDVDWERDRITVRSPKTEHHEGKESRTVPMFPELRPYLEAVFNEASDRLGRPPSGTDSVIWRYRDSGTNLRTQLTKIIRRAGLEPWPKLWQNLRSTRETELAQQFPMHVVCAWIGNSPAVAKAHYLQVTDADFERAAGRGAESGALSAETAAQNPAQPVAAASRQHPPRNENANAGLDLRPTLANRGESWHPPKVPPLGLEPRTL